MGCSSREAYRDELTRLAFQDVRILALEADLGGENHPFQKQFPHRFFNFGIAEMAAIDIAAGLAEAGYTPFFSTFASFAAVRSAESIKLSLAYMRKNVKLVAPYGGVSGGWFGPTHHCLEDIAIVSSMPGIKIVCPHGENETRRIIREAAKSIEPYYIRLGRNEVFTSVPSHAAWDEIVIEGEIVSDSDLCIVSVGETPTEYCRQAKQEHGQINHAHLVYVDKESVIRQVEQISALGQRILVVEESRLCGSVASLVALLLPKKEVHSFAVNDVWPTHGGSHQDVLDQLSFNARELMRCVSDLLGGS